MYPLIFKYLELQTGLRMYIKLYNPVGVLNLQIGL